MTATEIKTHTLGLILRISVITGWQAPEVMEYKNILVDQLKKKLVQDYYDLTVDEIEYAFRLYAHTVEDYGRGQTLVLFCKVVERYRKERSDAHKKLLDLPDSNTEFSLKTHVDWRGQIEENYQFFLFRSPFYQRSTLPFVYDTLVEDGWIQKGYYKKKFKLYQQLFTKPDPVLADKAKSDCVLELFRWLKKHKYDHIYVKGK